MMRRSLLPIVLLLSLVLGACSGLSGSGVTRTLSVTGTGTVTLAPDIVTVSLGVQTQGEDVARTVADNNRRLERVIAAAVEAGLASEDIRTTYFSVSPQQQYDPQGMPTGAVTYWVDNTLTVILRQPETLGSLLQAVLVAGANTIQGVSYGVDDTRQAESEARDEAMEDARERAELLAGAAGAALGDPLSISTVSAGPAYGASYGLGGIGGGAEAAVAVPVSPGSTQVQVQVYVVYELK